MMGIVAKAPAILGVSHHRKVRAIRAQCQIPQIPKLPGQKPELHGDRMRSLYTSVLSVHLA